MEHELKIQYLYHSGFRVETLKHLLIFDYMEGKINLGDKKTIVFASHAHPDHFNPDIFKWENIKTDIKYILSDDIPNDIPPNRKNVYFLPPYQEINVDGVNIKTFGSTDVGVSFLVQCDGLHLFHAGDLNWWYWWQDTPENIALAEKQFKDEIAKLKSETIDLAFFPVDQRLEHNYALGADYFIQEIAPRCLVPMHFGDQLETACKYAQKIKDGPNRIITFTKRDQEVSINI